jgi:O-antigen/teichoic acid export membrane protein
MKILEGKLARAIIGTFGLNIVEADLGFIIIIVLSCIMGAEDFVCFLMQWIWQVLWPLFVFTGQGKFTIREIAKLYAAKDLVSIKADVLGANAKASILALIITVLGALVLSYVTFTFSTEKINILYIALIVFMISMLIRLYTGFFQGIQKVTTSH